MVKKGMFAHLRTRPLHGLILEMLVKFYNNIVAGHVTWRVIMTMVRVEEAVDVKAILAFHAMHCTILVRVAKATEEAHEMQCIPLI